VLLGQPLGGLIAEFLGLAGPLIVYGGVCLFAGWLVLRFLVPVSGPSGTRIGFPARQQGLAELEAPLPSAWGRVRGLLSGRAFVSALVANAAIFWVMGSVRMTLFPLFGKEEVGLSELGIGAVLGAAALAQFATMWTAGTMTDTRGRRAVLLPSLLVLAASVAALGWSTSIGLLVITLAVLGVATGFAGVVPAAVVGDVVPREVSGTGVGLYRFAGDVGLVIGPAVGGAVADAGGFGPAFVVSAVPLVIAFALALRMPETLRVATRQSV
jgi:MFS family permease